MIVPCWKHPSHVDTFATLANARAAYPHVRRFKRCWRLTTEIRSRPTARGVDSGPVIWCPGFVVVVGADGRSGRLL